ncbi:hypothetical protein MSIMFI_01096 [Mycobacterium simulans]|nr:hypothetical protein MSIMFI_01096 [Mycobacterium simulans]
MITIVTSSNCGCQRVQLRKSNATSRGRCDMSAIPRIMSVSLASAAAIGLISAVGLAPRASAVPCSGDAANAPPPPNAVVTAPSSKTLGPIPRGPRPRGANERAPLPRLGPLSRLANPGQRYSAPLQPQAGVLPPGPNPPAPGTQQSDVSRFWSRHRPQPRRRDQNLLTSGGLRHRWPSGSPGLTAPTRRSNDSASPGPTSESSGTTAIPPTVRHS